jgi:hypothetical protein
MPVTHIWEVPDLNLGWNIGCPDWSFS